MASMAPAAGAQHWRRGSGPGTLTWGAVVFLGFFLCTVPASAIEVTVSDPYHVVIPFQSVTLPCTYQSTATPTEPIVIWKYKSFQDNVHTVHMVATKQGNAVNLGDNYQDRWITITRNGDLTFDWIDWGDSGMYYCSVFSAQDLQGNNEAYVELIVLDWLFVVIVVVPFLVFLHLLEPVLPPHVLLLRPLPLLP